MNTRELYKIAYHITRIEHTSYSAEKCYLYGESRDLEEKYFSLANGTKRNILTIANGHYFSKFREDRLSHRARLNRYWQDDKSRAFLVTCDIRRFHTSSFLFKSYWS